LKSFRPTKFVFTLAIVAFLLMIAGIGVNLFGDGIVRYWQVAFALTLLAFLVWFWGRTESGSS
jgi:hypothetical protein